MRVGRSLGRSELACVERQIPDGWPHTGRVVDRGKRTCGQEHRHTRCGHRRLRHIDISAKGRDRHQREAHAGDDEQATLHGILLTAAFHSVWADERRCQ